MYLLDTNHCSSIIQSNTTVINKIAEVGETMISTCFIVQGELFFMAYNSEQKARNLGLVRTFLEDINIYLPDDETTHIYGQFKAEIFERFGPKEKSKRRRFKLENLGIGENDLWIAAIALRHSLTIVSTDSDFTRMQEVRSLSVESWL